MVKPIDYVRVLYSIRQKLSFESCNLFSVVAYGSVCRLEMVPGFSDVDILVIIKEEYITERTSHILNNLIKDLSDIDIKIHLRIRNIHDLEFKTSGLFDCGVTSAINKLRDSIVLVGESLDNHYLSYIRNVTKEEIISNISFRFSDLRYQNRAFLSMCTGGSGKLSSIKDVNYKAGCILYQLAELVCYSNGIPFENSAAAIRSANNITNNPLFELAKDIKHGTSLIKLSSFVSNVDQMINSFMASIDQNKVKNILEIRINDIETQENDIFVRAWNDLIVNCGNQNGILVVKRPEIDSGLLTINRYRV